MSEILTVWTVVSEWSRDEPRRRVIELVSAEVVKTPTRYRFVAGRNHSNGYRVFVDREDADLSAEAAIARFRMQQERRRDLAYLEAQSAERMLSDLALVEVDYLDPKGAPRG